MDGKGDGEVEVGDWELLHHTHHDDPLLFGGPPLDSIRHDHFSLNSQPRNSNSSSSSNNSSELDRNFDDSYVANHLFHNPNLHPWNDSDSDATSASATTVINNNLIPEPDVDVDPNLNSKEEEEEEEEEEVNKGGGEEEVKEEEEKRLVVWWKVPFEVLKYWVNPLPLPLPLPVWSLSVAAAATFLGLFFLGRRLYRMKRKTQNSFKLNLALDDKVSQLMGRVARLNEAFSVVKRVPIVRPSLPPSSVTLRPVMSMR